MADFSGATREGVSKIRSSGSLVFDAVTKGTRRQEVSPPGLQHSDIAGQPVGEAQRKLETAKINVVKVEPYDPGAGLANLVEFGRAPLRLEEGARIRLITKDDKVLYYARVETDSPQIKTLREEVEATKAAVTDATQLRSELNTLKKEMLETEKKHQESLVARDKEIAELKVSAKELQLTIQAINELKEQVAKLSRGDKPARLVKRKKGESEPKG
jgi:myosin heavy subunit